MILNNSRPIVCLERYTIRTQTRVHHADFCIIYLAVRTYHHDHVRHEHGSRPCGLRCDYGRSQELHEEGHKSVRSLLTEIHSESTAHSPFQRCDLSTANFLKQYALLSIQAMALPLACSIAAISMYASTTSQVSIGICLPQGVSHTDLSMTV